MDKIGEAVSNLYIEKLVAVSLSESLVPISFEMNDILSALSENTTAPHFNNFVSWGEFIKGADAIKIIDYPKHEPDVPVAVVSTGGSTGTPKGVMLSNENVISATYQVLFSGFFPAEGRWYDIMPISIAYGMCDGSILPWALGNEVSLNPIPTVMSMKYPGQLYMVEDFVRFDPHSIACAPNHVFTILDSEEWKSKPHSLVSFGVGGDCLNLEQTRVANKKLTELRRPEGFDKERFYGDKEDIVVINYGYGQSECAGACSVAPSNHAVKEGTVGLTLPREIVTTFDYDEASEEYIELSYVPNDQINSVQDNQIAEICVQGPNLFLGYLNNAEETSQTLIKHQDGEIWLHTGDLGFIDEDGYVHFVDRLKYVCVRNDGFKVAPREIEDVIMQDKRISSCKAVVFDDPVHKNGSLIKVYYTISQDIPDAETGDIEHKANDACVRDLADYKCPVSYQKLDKLPITPSGKVDVMKLKEMASL